MGKACFRAIDEEIFVRTPPFPAAGWDFRIDMIAIIIMMPLGRSVRVGKQVVSSKWWMAGLAEYHERDKCSTGQKHWAGTQQSVHLDARYYDVIPK